MDKRSLGLRSVVHVGRNFYIAHRIFFDPNFLICGLILGAVLARHLTSPADERNSWRRGVFVVAAIVFALSFSLVRRAVLHALTGQYGS